MANTQQQLTLAIAALSKIKGLTRPGSGAWLAADDALKNLQTHSPNSSERYRWADKVWEPI